MLCAEAHSPSGLYQPIVRSWSHATLLIDHVFNIIGLCAACAPRVDLQIAMYDFLSLYLLPLASKANGAVIYYSATYVFDTVLTVCAYHAKKGGSSERRKRTNFKEAKPQPLSCLRRG